MLIVLVILAVIWVILGIFSWSVGGYFAFWRTPERMARKHPETIDPHTGQQRVLMDLRDGSSGGSGGSGGHSRRRPANRARKWAFRARRHL